MMICIFFLCAVPCNLLSAVSLSQDPEDLELPAIVEQISSAPAAASPLALALLPAFALAWLSRALTL